MLSWVLKKKIHPIFFFTCIFFHWATGEARHHTMLPSILVLGFVQSMAEQRGGGLTFSTAQPTLVPGAPQAFYTGKILHLAWICNTWALFTQLLLPVTTEHIESHCPQFAWKMQFRSSRQQIAFFIKTFGKDVQCDKPLSWHHKNVCTVNFQTAWGYGQNACFEN